VIKEHEIVVLTEDLDSGMRAGDVGTVVHVYPDGKAFEVEFMTFTGQTAAVLTVRPAQIRKVGDHEVAHVRSLGAA
jgi:hypothetical protein